MIYKRGVPTAKHEAPYRRRGIGAKAPYRREDRGASGAEGCGKELWGGASIGVR